jgi:hypothetical protein
VSSPGSGALRAVRAGLLGLVCVLLALSGHLAGGGHAPSPWAVVILALPMAALCLGLTARRRGVGSIGAVVAGSQLVLHEALMWFQAGTACTGPADVHAHAHLPAHLGQAEAVSGCRPMAGMASALPAGAGGSRAAALMVLSHALAAAVTTVVLAHGEALLWRLWHRLTRGVPQAHVRLVPATRGAAWSSYDAPAGRRARGSARRRAPPAAAAA